MSLDSDLDKQVPDELYRSIDKDGSNHKVEMEMDIADESQDERPAVTDKVKSFFDAPAQEENGDKKPAFVDPIHINFD